VELKGEGIEDAADRVHAAFVEAQTDCSA
jgi:hypothetical protein